jgi:hypothetical protein
MTCIHGLDEINCPTCRLIRSVVPLNPISNFENNKKDLRSKNSLFEKNTSLKTDFYKDLQNNNVSQPNILQQIPELTKFGEIPNYSNYLFNERLRSLQPSKTTPKPKVEIDKHNIELE